MTPTSESKRELTNHKKSMKTRQPHAVVTIRRASTWTDSDRKEIAHWLREQAKALIKDGRNYSLRFTARYYD